MITSILLVLSYTIYFIIKDKELPESISSLVYKLKDKYRIVWVIWMEMISITIAPHLLLSLPENFKIVGFLTILCLMFCGAIPLKKNLKNTAHNVLGISAGILSLICVTIINPIMLAGWAVFPIYKLLLKYIKKLKNKDTFIAEAICWITTTLTLL